MIGEDISSAVSLSRLDCESVHELVCKNQARHQTGTCGNIVEGKGILIIGATAVKMVPMRIGCHAGLVCRAIFRAFWDRQRSNLPERNRPPMKWSNTISTTSFGLPFQRVFIQTAGTSGRFSRGAGGLISFRGFSSDLGGPGLE
jgi:hypothetical protein